MQRLYIARHGEADADTRELTERGKQHAADIAERLKAVGVGAGGIILSSVTRRTVQTSNIIKAEMGMHTVAKSKYVTFAGERPQPIGDLHGFAANVLNACGVEHEAADVLMVTHKPLVKAVAGAEPEFGDAYLVPSGWQNPQHFEDFARLVDDPDTWGRGISLA